MKNFIRVLAIAAIIMIWPAQILAAVNANHIVISEVQTSSATDAAKEFVELFNPTDSPVTIDGWIVEYASATGTTWSKKATLNGVVAAHGFYLVATSGYLLADAPMSSGLASTGGHLRIKDMGGAVVDLVGWGTAINPEGTAANAPIAGGSIERLPGRLNDLAGNSQDEDNNGTDFVQREVADPQNKLAATEDPALTETTTPDSDDTTPPDDVPPTPLTYLPVFVTEVFPDPASPLTDAKDEYIELFNPNTDTISLKGYVLRTGTSFKSYYTIGDVSLPPGGYVAFFSSTTSLALSNAGSAVQVLDPLGTILDQSDPYGVAKTGQTWADINGVWSWTLELTAGAANVLQAPPGSSTSQVIKSATATKKTAVKKAASSKKTTAKTSKATTKKAKTTTSKTGIAATTSAISDPSPLTRWLLIGAGCFTIMYAIYGFRHDLYNYYIKARRNSAAWLQDRPTLPWRRNN